MSNIVSSLSKT